MKIANSKLTIGGEGCVVMSMATLFQVDPKIILAIPGAFTSEGLAITGVIAAALGGKALPAQKTPPKGWCMAVTNKYAPQFPTHFFPFNADVALRVDPLDFPAEPERNNYGIVEYRPFDGVKFDHTALKPKGPFPDVPPERGDAAAIARLKNQGIVNGYPDGMYRPDQFVTRGEMAIMIDRAKNA